MTLVYCSETGFTARYAQLLHDRTGLPLLSLDRAERELAQGSRAVFLGWLRAGSIQGLKRAAKRFELAAVCAVGMARTYETDALARQNHLEGVPLFYLRGGYAPDSLRGVHKAMMKVAGAALRKAAEKEPDGQEMIAALDGGADWVTAEALDGVTGLLGGV